jgi:hypothetical protein
METVSFLVRPDGSGGLLCMGPYENVLGPILFAMAVAIDLLRSG